MLGRSRQGDKLSPGRTQGAGTRRRAEAQRGFAGSGGSAGGKGGQGPADLELDGPVPWLRVQVQGEWRPEIRPAPGLVRPVPAAAGPRLTRSAASLADAW